MTPEQERELDRIRRMPWSAIFHKTLDNPTVPGGKVDMYLLIDDDSGEGIVGLSVPHGQGWIAEYVAGCCANPYFVREMPGNGVDMAIAMNRAIKPFFGKDGMIDGREVYVAAMTMIEGYVAPMAKRARQELIDNTMAKLRNLRDAEDP